jgi:hypothetical protein
MSNTKNNACWERLFEEHKIKEKILKVGCVSISSAEINKVREARLMTKFDHRSQLPKIFSDNHFSILPTSRGNYVIGEFDTFCNFDSEEVEITPIDFPTHLESLDYKDITSEATAINCAFAAQILHNFTGESSLMPTVSGRMSSSAFKFAIDSKRGLFEVLVDNSQIEIDGGYEGDASLILIEAKNYISDDFLVRQLYYPYKLWAKKISKLVRPVFLTYTNGVFHLREYIFDNIDHYNSLQLVRQKKYAVRNLSFNVETLQQILDSTRTVKEPDIPFPQADKFERVVNLCELLQQRGVLTKEEITQNYDFDARQSDYYANAGKYLGLIDRISGKYFLTTQGQRLFAHSLADRQLEFVKLILSHATFKTTLNLYFDKGSSPDKDEIVEIMAKSKIYNVESNSTFHRRASTIIGWISWILDQVEE